jgi:hypothetical protein
MRKPRLNDHQIATWSGVSSFFATILAIGAINILNPNDRLRFISALFVGLITAGAVYARERLHDARGETGRLGGNIVVTDKDGVKKFSLELLGDPNELDKQSEVLFKVDKRKIAE